MTRGVVALAILFVAVIASLLATGRWYLAGVAFGYSVFILAVAYYWRAAG